MANYISKDDGKGPKFVGGFQHVLYNCICLHCSCGSTYFECLTTRNINSLKLGDEHSLRQPIALIPKCLYFTFIF
jgi:hypothetical protein